jgi:hypothetical protein
MKASQNGCLEQTVRWNKKMIDILRGEEISLVSFRQGVEKVTPASAWRVFSLGGEHNLLTGQRRH